ncbi:DUF222 domain-containing protein [Pseudonocardia sp. NPDC046786]|uniref:HNH endonuclease signature motif containing protein n=1 Tax=Pseudonocardia sp. NPDC046786 TaxID=3155471 RepID=UPI0033F4CABA
MFDDSPSVTTDSTGSISVPEPRGRRGTRSSGRRARRGTRSAGRSRPSGRAGPAGAAAAPGASRRPEPPRWSGHAPGTALVAVLERPPVPGTSGHERLERIAAFERTIAWLQTRQEVEIAGYVADAERAAVSDTRRAGTSPPDAFDSPEHAARSATAEIQLILHLTGSTMLARLERARLLHQDPVLEPTATLAHAGLLTAPKTRKILDGAAGLDPAQATLLQDTVLPKAPTQTTGQLGAAIRRFLVSLPDREVPARRRERAGRARGVTVQPGTDSMAVLRAYLPSAAATGIYAVLDETARRRPCRSAADTRTMDQRRADALTDIVLHPTGHVSEGTAATAGAPGASPAPPPAAPAPAGPGSSGTPPDPPAPAADSGSGAPSARPAAPAVVPDIPGVAPAPPGMPPPPHPSVSVRINVTVSLDTLLGADDAPAELAGHGPIPAADARALAFATGSVWYRLITDPVSGRVLHRDTTRYRPDAALAELIRARHPACTHPGCRVPAHRCDLDHVVPHGPDRESGPTSADNLHPLCRSHHRLKHSPGWEVRLLPDGSTRWTTPSGHVHVAEPTPVGPGRAGGATGRRGPRLLALLRDPGLADRLATGTAESPF